MSQGDRVILVHSLVTGGTAEKDGRIQKGDKLLSVNGVSVVNHSLEFTVEQLTSTAEVMAHVYLCTYIITQCVHVCGCIGWVSSYVCQPSDS